MARKTVEDKEPIIWDLSSTAVSGNRFGRLRAFTHVVGFLYIKMNYILNLKKDLFVDWILGQSTGDVSSIIEKIKTGGFDLVDYKVDFEKIDTDELLYKFIFLYIYLANTYVISKLNVQDIEFLEYILVSIHNKLNIKLEWSEWAKKYNNEMINFYQYREFISKDKLEGTLFWEFGIQISKIISKQSLAHIIILVKRLVVNSYTTLSL